VTESSVRSERIARVRAALLAFYDAEKRDLPWRQRVTAYRTWVSEIMLQQTRVETVVPYFNAFMQTFPTAHALAEATSDQVLAAWSGLGYYRRARMLHEGAKVVVRDHGGEMPATRDALLGLPGIGRYTAGAIASIAFGEEAPLVDGNVVRVLARVFGIDRELSPQDDELWEIAQALVRGPRPGDLNQALMEMGATLCTKSSPGCERCPLSEQCSARPGDADPAFSLGIDAHRRPQRVCAALCGASALIAICRAFPGSSSRARGARRMRGAP